MLIYKAAYTYSDDGWVCAQVVDFPAAISQGRDLNDARDMLSSALAETAEWYVLDGRPLPLPNPNAELAEEPDRFESIYLMLAAGPRVSVQPATPAPLPAVVPAARAAA